jgi:hypothetical protein
LKREGKPDWENVPSSLRAKIEACIGEPVRAADIVWGGFGPSATFVLTGESGARYFCKGTHPGQTPQGHAALLRERYNYEHFPEIEAFGPRYIGGVDDGDWHMAVLDYVPRAQNVPPWVGDLADRTIALVARFHKASPERAARKLTPVQDLVGFNPFRVTEGWVSLAKIPEHQAQFAALFVDEDAAHLWLTANGEPLAGMEARAETIGGPRSWLHLDIRSDNLVFAADGSVKLVDWPIFAYGPSLLDIAFFLPSLAGEGGPACAESLRLYEREAGKAFDPEDVALAAVTVAGFFAARAGAPEIPVLPRLRWVQKLQLFPALDWICQVLGLSPLPVPRPF